MEVAGIGWLQGGQAWDVCGPKAALLYWHKHTWGGGLSECFRKHQDWTDVISWAWSIVIANRAMQALCVLHLAVWAAKQ